MRNELFHSTLGWYTEPEFRRGAKKVWRLFQENRAEYEVFTASVKAVFEAPRAKRLLAEQGK